LGKLLTREVPTIRERRTEKNPVFFPFTWRKTKEYKVTVQEVRRRTLDRPVGHFARNLTKAADRIALLATEAGSESVQLQAARAVLKEFMEVREHVDLEEQMVDIERRLDERDAKVP